jgi:hypothetical protein
MKEEVELELAMLREHLESLAVLRKKVASSPPDMVETMALGAFLHGFYNGVENAFKRVAIHMNGGAPRGDAWHQRLLESMTRPGGSRPAVLSPALAETLLGYLDFRHIFRHIYSHRLDWPRMADLVARCEDTLNRLERELGAFLKATEGKE